MKSSLFAIGLIATSLFNVTNATTISQTKSKFVISSYAKTKYPIIFTHGMLGFNHIGGPSLLGVDYFYQVLPDLARFGATVFAAQVSPVETTEVRGEQLLQQVEDVLAVTGANKVNLIGHSHGGPTIRYIEIVAPRKVASLTAVAGTFKGSKVADDILEQKLPKTLLTIAVDYMLAPAITLLEGNKNLPVSFQNSLESISEKGSLAFNAKHPSLAIPRNCGQGLPITFNGVYHFSWTGTAQATNKLDVIDTAISKLAPYSYNNTDNDGLVDRCSTHYGLVIRDNYNHTHLDEINQVLGLRKFSAPDPVSLYRQHASRLKLLQL